MCDIGDRYIHNWPYAPTDEEPAFYCDNCGQGIYCGMYYHYIADLRICEECMYESRKYADYL